MGIDSKAVSGYGVEPTEDEIIKVLKVTKEELEENEEHLEEFLQDLCYDFENEFLEFETFGNAYCGDTSRVLLIKMDKISNIKKGIKELKSFGFDVSEDDIQYYKRVYVY